MAETFKDIPGYTGYQVSDLGRVRSTKYKQARFLSTHVNKRTGYPTVRLFENNKGKTYEIHKLVMLAFVGPRPDGMCVLHRVSDRTNCALSNLHYGTQSENILQAFDEGSMSNESKRKLTRKQAVFIRLSPLSAIKIAEMFGVAPQTIDMLRAGKTYKDCLV